ncbi:hypothetical protein KR222_005120 [Zaprionus bogoriensis]|nr:hypothetical protein KR222_005120 [Zaprionus bogoriensis]
MPPHRWTDESRDASCYYGNALPRSSSDADDDDTEADDERGAFCAGDRPLIAGNSVAPPGEKELLQTRHIFGLMGFLGFAVVYAMRVNLSVAIVAMVNQTAIPHSNSSLLANDTCPMPPSPPPNETLQHFWRQPPAEGEFVWDEATQGLVLGSFFYGYVLTQVPGGRMAELYGGKRIYGYGVLITAIFTMLTPLAAHWDLPLFVLVRILEGMGEGVTYPAMHAMLAHWIPPLERNKFAAVVYAGSNIGTVISMPLTGWLCSQRFLGGWPSAFYIFGLLGMLWFVCWMYLVYDRPSEHPRISRKERAYIERSLQLHEEVQEEEEEAEHLQRETHQQPEQAPREQAEQQRQADAPIPWGSLLTSVPLWAILLTQCGQSWAFYTQLTELPTYMSNILHFDIQSNALLNAVPSLTAWFMGIACSALADWMLARRYITQLNSYKLWNSISSVVPSLGLIGIIYVGCDWVWVTFMLAGVGSLGGAVYAGNQMNHIALSPKYAGTMYGITNSAANICGFLAPYVIGLIINHRETLTQWHIVFWLAAGLNIAGNFIYVIFASADEQPWSKRRPVATEARRPLRI